MARAMAQEWRRIAQEDSRSSAPSSSSAKVRKPDPFDGSDPHKLDTFFTQLNLVFRSDPHRYSSDEEKVTYATSYLKGTALAWFEPDLQDPGSHPDWMYSYSEFRDIL